MTTSAVSTPHLSTDHVKHGATIAARLGYLTHGLVYGLMGALALLSAFGSGGGVTDREGAVKRIGETGFGEALLWAVAVGLACYALWNVIRALLDPENRGRDAKGLLTRAFYGISAVSHGLLAVHTFQLAYGAATSSGSQTQTIAKVFDYPGGRVLIGLIGLGVIGFGMFEVYRSITGAVEKELNGASLPHHRQLVLVGRIGHGARGVVFGIVGASLLVAAVAARPREAQGFGDALRELASQPFGSVLLGIIAAGLVAYGLDMLILARYARIPKP